jgi:3-phytase
VITSEARPRRAARGPAIAGVLTAVGLWGASCAPRQPALPAERLAGWTVVGDAVLPSPAPDGTARPDVGGLSGAFYDERRGVLYAVSDDRARPRLVTFAVEVAPALRVTPRDVIPLERPHTRARSLDAEGVAPAPGGHLFVSSEGNAADPGAPAPGIYEYTRDGRFVRSLPLPRRYLGSQDGSGMRDNGAFEGLTSSPDGKRLFAAIESSLRQDGADADFERGAVVRLLAYELPVLGPPREYAYRTDPLQRPDTFGDASGEAGVAAILALDAKALLVLERGFVRETTGAGARSANTIRIYRVALDSRAEITGRTSLLDRPPAAVLEKTLVLDGASIAAGLSAPLRSLENFEAMTFGPRLPDGRPTLLLISDDNFSERQVTAVVVLAMGP